MIDLNYDVQQRFNDAYAKKYGFHLVPHKFFMEFMLKMEFLQDLEAIVRYEINMEEVNNNLEETKKDDIIYTI